MDQLHLPCCTFFGSFIDQNSKKMVPFKEIMASTGTQAIVQFNTAYLP
jgi:hypothetical protein